MLVSIRHLKDQFFCLNEFEIILMGTTKKEGVNVTHYMTFLVLLDQYQIRRLKMDNRKKVQGVRVLTQSGKPYFLLTFLAV